MAKYECCIKTDLDELMTKVEDAILFQNRIRQGDYLCHIYMSKPGYTDKDQYFG